MIKAKSVNKRDFWNLTCILNNRYRFLSSSKCCTIQEMKSSLMWCHPHPKINYIPQSNKEGRLYLLLNAKEYGPHLLLVRIREYAKRNNTRNVVVAFCM